MLKRFAVLALCVSSLAHAHTLKLHNGKELKLNNFTFREGQLVPDKGDPIPRDRIKEISFEYEQPKATAARRPGVAQDVQAVLQLAREQRAKYPDAAGILLEDDGVFTLRADGTNAYRYHFRGLVLKEEKKREWGQQGMYFDDQRERVRLLWARTILPDGRVIEVDPATARIAAPAGRTGHFGKGKIFSFSLPQIDVGSIVEHCYEREEFDPFDPNMFFPSFYFQGQDPVTHSKMTVVMPSSKELNYQARNMPPGKGQPVVTKGKDTVTYVWDVSDMAPMIPEPQMPPEEALVASVRCSPFKTWDYLYDWMTRFQKRRMKVTPEIEQLVAKVTKGAKDKEEMVARLYHFVQQHIRYVSIKGSIGSGWAGHEAAFTCKNRYGDCIDKAIVFGTLLKVIEVPSEPVIVLTNDRGVDDRQLPTMRGNHAISQVHLDGRSFYLDSTSSVHRYPSFSRGDHGITAINALRREIGFIEVPPPEMNTRDYALTVTVAPQGDADVFYRSRYVGNYEAGVRGYYMYTQESDHLRVLSGLVSSMAPKARLVRHKLRNVHDISKPFSMRMWFSIPGHVMRAGQLRIFSVPGIEAEFPEIALAKRKYDLVYSTSLRTIRHVKIAVPPNYRVKYLPPPIDLKTPYATFEARYQHTGGSAVLFTSTFRRITRVVPVSGYQTYRTFLQKMSKYTKEQMFFEEVEGK